MAEMAAISDNTVQEKNIDVPQHSSEIEDIKRLDTVQADEALKVVANYDGDETWTEDEEKKVLKKIDRSLMPILCITYGLQYYDKSMLGQAVSFHTPLKYLILTFIGPFWVASRSGHAYRDTLLLLVFYFLSWIYSRCLASRCPCTEISYRKNCFWPCRNLGDLSWSISCLHELQGILRSAFLSRFS